MQAEQISLKPQLEVPQDNQPPAYNVWITVFFVMIVASRLATVYIKNRSRKIEPKLSEIKPSEAFNRECMETEQIYLGKKVVTEVLTQATIENGVVLRKAKVNTVSQDWYQLQRLLQTDNKIFQAIADCPSEWIVGNCEDWDCEYGFKKPYQFHKKFSIEQIDEFVGMFVDHFFKSCGYRFRTAARAGDLMQTDWMHCEGEGPNSSAVVTKVIHQGMIKEDGVVLVSALVEAISNI